MPPGSAAWSDWMRRRRVPPSAMWPWPPTTDTVRVGSAPPSSSVSTSCWEKSLPRPTPPLTVVARPRPLSTESETRAIVMISCPVSPSSRPDTGVMVMVASCTVLDPEPVKNSFGSAEVRPSTVTPVPCAATAKSGVAWPGSRAPVAVVRVSRTSIISRAIRGRERASLATAVSAASPSVIRVSSLVSETRVASPSLISASSIGSSVETVYPVQPVPPTTRAVMAPSGSSTAVSV